MRDALFPFAQALPIGLGLGLAGTLLGWFLATRWSLPLIQGVAGFVGFLHAWTAGGAGAAATTVAAWAVGVTGTSLAIFMRAPARVDRVVLRSKQYRESMLRWLETGRGPEARPLALVGRHAAELAAYLVAALATANLFGLILGAVMLNYMNAYVARLLAAARKPWPVRLLAWNSWSVIRVGAYIALGVAAASPALAAAELPAAPAEVRALVAVGVAGVVADVVLKILLSRPCGALLAASVDLEKARTIPRETGA